jgi:hypothetical protein
MSEPARPAIALVFGSVTPPQGDVVELFAHLGCSKEVSSYEVKLHNHDGKYSPGGASPITVGLAGSISLGRGATCPLLMTLKVEDVKYESTPNQSYITVSGRCWGEKLFRRVVTKSYLSQKGEAIIKDLIDYYAGLSHVRSSVELIEDTDTTYTKLDYTDSPVWDILKYVAETSDKSGVIGFDFRVAPDGRFEFFPKLSKTNAVAIVDNIDGQTKYSKSISRIRNMVTIYGLADKTVPVDKVSWTRSLMPADGSWGSTSGFISLDSAGAPDGGACIKLSVTSLYYGGCRFSLNTGAEVNCELYPLLNLQFKLELAYSGNGLLILFDYTWKSATKVITVSPDTNWHCFEVGVGSAYINQWEQIEAGFDWTKVKRVEAVFYFSENVGTGSFFVHQLYFGGRRYSAIAEDTASQVAYTDGEPREYVETDEELWSDHECDLRAKALLAYLKDPAENLSLTSTLLDFGSSPILAGDKVDVHLPVEGVDGDFRVESVEYRVSAGEGKLEITLELGKEPPQLADYLYGLRTFTVNVEKLSRTKIGRRGIPVATQGGSGRNSSYFNSNVDIDKTSPVLNLLTSRVLKAAFGFDGANTFLTTYIGDLILRSNSQLIRPYTDGSDDLGSSTFQFGNLHVKGVGSLGWLNIGGFTVITDALVLQNLTADAALITSGQFGLARLPRDASGKVLESQGSTLDPMYVNPNARYIPASHTHAATDINSGTLAEARIPNVFTGAITFQGGIITNNVNCANWQLADAIFANDFRITEAEKLGYPKGIAFQNNKGKTIMVLSEKGNLNILGKFRESLPKTRKKNRIIV